MPHRRVDGTFVNVGDMFLTQFKLGDTGVYNPPDFPKQERYGGNSSSFGAVGKVFFIRVHQSQLLINSYLLPIE